jgi:hypothetical protein
MHDPGAVRLGERLGDLHRDVEQPPRRQRPGREQLAQARTVDELHRDVGGAVRGADLVDRDDVGMVERGGGARLGLEAPQALGVVGERRRQHLDRDVASETRILRAVDLAHPAGAELTVDLVRPELGARGEGHAFVIPSAAKDPFRSRAAQRSKRWR